MHESSVSSFFGAGWSGLNARTYRASFTIEATMVLGVVFLTFAALLRHAYITHDIVTGTMILAEAVEKSRAVGNSDVDVEVFEQDGEKRGNPRLWLGTYDLEIEVGSEKVSGAASIGEQEKWKREMEISIFRPGRFLRRVEGLKRLAEQGEVKGDGRSRISERNESELYGNLPEG